MLQPYIYLTLSMIFAFLGHLWLTYIPNETGTTRATSEIPLKKEERS